MNQNLMIEEALFEWQFAALREERCLYVARATKLIREPNRTSEFQGYLRLIEKINEASIELARRFPHCPAGTPAHSV